MEWDLQRLKGLAVSETGVLFDPATGLTYTLNEVGTAVLKAFQEGQDPEEVRSLLAERYDVDGAVLERDLKEFLTCLKSFGLA